MSRERIFPLTDRPQIFEGPNGSYFYRGAKLKRMNSYELNHGLIEGEAQKVFHISGLDLDYTTHGNLSISTRDFLRGILTTDPGHVPGDKVELEMVEDRYITGGLSDNLGTGFHFGTPAYEHGLTLIMDKRNIPDNIQEIKYNIDFFQQYPSVGAYVSTLSNSAVLNDGELVALAKVKEDSATLGSTGAGVEDELTRQSFSEEDEAVAINSEIIKIRDAIEGVGAYYGTGTSPHSLSAIYNREVHKKTSGNFNYMDIQSQAQVMYDDLMDKMVDYEEELSVIIVEDVNDVHKGEETIDEDDFILLYDGHDFIYDVERAGPYV